MRAAKVQASLRIRAVSPEPPLLAHTSSESRGTFRQKARSLALLNGWACAVKTCHDGMFEDTNSLDGAQLVLNVFENIIKYMIVLFVSGNVDVCDLAHYPIYLRLKYLNQVDNSAIVARIPSLKCMISSFAHANSYKELSHVMRKPVYHICEQQRRRSACASKISRL